MVVYHKGFKSVNILDIYGKYSNRDKKSGFRRGLFDGLLKGMMPAETSRFLDAIVRIRAVQDFAPSEAIRFIFRLKDVIRKELAEALQDAAVSAEMVPFEGAIDDLALFAFDLYLQCREKIYDIKANEARSATFRLLQQAKILTEHQE